MIRLLLFFTGVLSFIYFLHPDVFPTKRSLETTLGLSQINQRANAEIVRQALVIHCINTDKLPTSLNQLYGTELSKEKFVDLDAIYKLVRKTNCEFELKTK